MRIRKTLALLGALTALAGCILLYLMMNLSFPSKSITGVEEFKDNQWLHFEGRLNKLELTWNKHEDVIEKIKKQIDHLKSSTHATISINRNVISNDIEQNDIDKIENQLTLAHSTQGKISEIKYDKECPIQINNIPQNTNIQMLDLYKELNFDDIDGGVWKQGFDINYDIRQWNKRRKLKVFVVPHSHNDPGWLKTFEEYYIAQTRNIFNNMVQKLGEHPSRKFIWAEVSFLDLWWKDADDLSKEAVRQYLRSGQLEIVTGGWVMNDEANSHYNSILQQLTTGHQWLIRNLNYTPQSAWTIDPFGLSPVNAEIYKGANLKNLLIQRVHYIIKKHLASQRELEFRWKQLWDGTGKSNLFTHMMPFYSYDVPHTCGPDPKICCQFDFKRLPGHGLTCPWHIPPQVITKNNVAYRAELLLDQYRKKSQLFSTNVVLIPLGDDFRYDHPSEWNNQYTNYQLLFDYMNTNPLLNVEAKFGTLTDYFNAVKQEKTVEHFSTLTGDFFTYADRNAHYWSGYYTSRPLYKRMDRILLSYVKAADIILTLMQEREILSKENKLVTLMENARRSLSLFQHHDGVTGTARDHVVIDYAEKMLKAIDNCQFVIQYAANVLLSGPSQIPSGMDTTYYNVDEVIRTHSSVPERQVITIGRGASTKKVVLYNPLTFTRNEVIRFLVSTPFVQVTDASGTVIPCQMSPIFENDFFMSETKYEVAFVANVPSFGLITYTIQYLEPDEVPRQTTFASIKIYNHFTDVKSPLGFSDIEVIPTAREFVISNKKISAAFSKLGLLKAIRVGKDTVPVHLDFARYGVIPAHEKSGAYLFLPDGDARPINIESTIVKVIEGPIFSSVIVQLPKVLHSAVLYNSPGADNLGLQIQNLVDISDTSNYELAMRLSTTIKSESEFFTDLNGHQIIRRKRFPKLPLQGNYYPMPTAAYIEDKNYRLTILTGSPLGCSSLKPGQMEIMLDRRLNQDDNRGLEQGVTDNHPTRHIFNIVLEKRSENCQVVAENHPSGFHTISSHLSSQTLLNPMIKLLRNDDSDSVSDTEYSKSEYLGVDFSIASLRSAVYSERTDDNIGLVINRQYLDTCYKDDNLLNEFSLSSGTVNISAILPFAKEAWKSSLTYLSLGDKIDIWRPQSICPMSTEAFIIKR